MTDSLQSEIDYSMLPTAFKVGFWDSLNPYSFATILIFIILLSIIGSSARRVFVFGGVFIFSCAAIHYTTLTGSWDHLLTNEHFVNGVSVIYFVIAIFFILIGVNDILDWRRYRQSNDVGVFRMPVPAIFREKDSSKKRSLEAILLGGLLTLVLTMALALGTSLMAMIAPQDEYMFIVHSYLLSGGEQDFVAKSFGLYVCAAILLLVVAWVKIWWLVLKKKKSINALLYYKLILSAIFISTAIGLGYYFIK